MKIPIPWRLIIRHLKGENTPENEMLFQQWMTTDENRMLFDEIEILWKNIQEEVSVYDPDMTKGWKELQSRLNEKTTKKKVLSPLFMRVASMAAGILLLLGITFLYTIHSQENERQTYSIMNGKSHLTLPDGTTVWLNAGTTVSYADAFAKNRILKLNGEASFQVTKDARHPFIVETSGIQVKVHGTSFNVEAYEEEEYVSVILESGSVSILYNDRESFLEPGEMARYHKKEQTLNIDHADLSLAMFWANESVYFKSESLRHICKYLEKWYRIQIEVDPDIADTQQYTFTIKDDSLEAILRIMSKINPITYSFEDENHVKIMKVNP
ncbi:MAG: FecR domain-containing protein [Tannerellaceae bacterium]|nr:FecR domain-containing protein [Tannerellaceae bacterium]